MASPSKRGFWSGAWEGGRVWRSVDASSLYFIRRQLNGHRYEVSTGATTLRGAMEQLKRFEADPEGYDPRGEVRPDAIYLDAKLADEFLAWSEEEKGNTARWVGQQRLYLAWWADKLKGIDLRRASLADHILPALRRATARPQRTAVLKVLYAWLRKERHSITAAEDPTLGTITVPQSRPEQLKRRKAVTSDHVNLAIEHLASERWRDLLRVLAGTGMHVSELERFAATGTIEPLPRDGRAEGASGAIVIPSTKAGDPLRVAVSAEVLAAAERVLSGGSFDRQHFAKALHSACLAARITPFGAGQLRHSVATWAVNAGADPSAVAAFLGHRSPRTTRRFYATLATPAKVPTLL